MAEITLLYYENADPMKSTIANFTRIVTEKNPLRYNIALNPSMYVMMVNKFLVDIALGMVAKKIWQRVYQATGGYLVVRTDGEILCYHFYFTTKFETFLFSNTRLETPQANKHRFGKVYEEDGFQKIKLNLQVRFLK